MLATLIGILIAVFLFILGLFFIIPTGQADTIYKDYCVDDNAFTVHLLREKDYLFDTYDVKITICEPHLPPPSRWAYVKQCFKTKVYQEIYWRPALKTISLEDFIIQEIKEVIKEEKKKVCLEKEWQDFCKTNNIVIKKEKP
jgi:hypothetical protein